MRRCMFCHSISRLQNYSLFIFNCKLIEIDLSSVPVGNKQTAVLKPAPEGGGGGQTTLHHSVFLGQKGPESVCAWLGL